MKTFLHRILIFCIPVFAFVIISLVYYTSVRIANKSKFENISNFETVLMGDSQMQRINTNYFDTKTHNFASKSEHYYFTYQKLLQLLNNKHSIKRIVLGVSIHNFSPVYNRLFNASTPEGKKSLERYLYFINYFKSSDFIKRPTFDHTKNIIKGLYKTPTFDGFFESEKKNPDDQIIKRILDMHYSVTENESAISNSQILYLNRIDSLCKAQNIDLYLVSTPYHTDYKNEIKKEYVDVFYETIGNLNNAHHINFLSDNPSPDWMSDANHLNKVGAAIYSKKMNAIINASINKN